MNRILISALGVLLYLTVVSFSSANEIKFKIGREYYNFVPFTDVRPEYSYFGVYQHPLAFTGGDRLYLFPDLKFMVVSWCDICKKKLVAKGTYVNEEGRILLSYDFKSNEFKSKLIDKSLFVLSGSSDSHSSEVVLVNDEGLKGMIEGKAHIDYLRRIDKYYDWQAVANGLNQLK
jgi:hypothetical protein